MRTEVSWKLWKRASFVLIIIIFAFFTLSTTFFKAGTQVKLFHHWFAEQYSGKVVEIREDSFVISNRTGKEVTVFIDGKTEIWQGRELITTGSLQVGTNVIIVGSATNEEGVVARIIRIFSSAKLRNE